MSDAWLEHLDLDTCLQHLRAERIGRVAVVANESPILLPVNFRLVETAGLTWVAFRTRPGNVIDQPGARVAFEIDGIDATNQAGWSVLVQGTLQHVDPEAASFRDRFDAAPWLLAERDAWLVIEPFSISGRELHPSGPGWAFDPRAYL